MVITTDTVAQKIIQYLQHHITLAELVDWAENALMGDDDFDEADAETIADIVAYLGASDSAGFELTWAICEAFLRRLGYAVTVSASKIAP